MIQKLYLVSVLLFAVPLIGQAQKTATTSDGEKVLLFADGTWKLDSSAIAKQDTSLKKFKKPAQALKSKTSQKVDYVFWYDESKWLPSKNDVSPAAEFTFRHKKGDAYAIVITERIGMDVNTLKKVALERAESVSENFKVEKEETRVVNGITLAHVVVSGKIQGVNFVYYNYYYGDDNGAIQIICFTAKNLLKDYEKDFENILNGFTAK